LSVSGYHYRGLCKITDAAFNKVTTYNRRTLNHFTEQVNSFRMADKDASKREDDLTDAYNLWLIDISRQPRRLVNSQTLGGTAV